jgi:hypothetical protein
MLCAIFILGGFVFQVEAGMLMVSLQESYGQFKDRLISKAYVEKNHMRVETTGKNLDNIVIYRKDKGVFWFIDNKEKTFMEITKKDMQKMKTKMDEAMRMMEEQMKNMPPEQRKMMENMMKGRMPVQPKTTYKKIASNLKVNQWVCDKYEGYLNGKKTKEIWTTDSRKLGLSQEYLAVMGGLSEFFGEVTKDHESFYKTGSKEWEKEQGYSGIPIKTITYSAGKIKDKTELKEIRRQDFASSLFDLPKGLMKKEYPRMREYLSEDFTAST